MSGFTELVDDFELLDDWEERYRYIIELGRALPELDSAFKTAATKVSGCASQVWIYTRPVQTQGGAGLVLAGDSDALIVKGLIAVLFRLFDGMTVEQILAFDPQEVFSGLGLADHLTPQRSNGLTSMVKRIKADAREILNDGGRETR